MGQPGYSLMVTRDTIVKAARAWLGTPYHHQASVKGIGTDCLGLIRGIWRELYGPEPETMPAYTRDWGDATGSETLLAAACRHLVKLEDASAAQAGDVLVFRMRDEGVAKHAGIIVALPATSEALSRGALHERNGLFERDAAPSPRRKPGSRAASTESAALDSGLRRYHESIPRLLFFYALLLRVRVLARRVRVNVAFLILAPARLAAFCRLSRTDFQPPTAATSVMSHPSSTISRAPALRRPCSGQPVRPASLARSRK